MITFSARNIVEFQKEFDTDEKCRNYIALKRWGNSPACPYCGSLKVYTCKGGKRYKCGEKECGSTFSVLVGTIFENTKIPLTCWFYAMYVALNHKKGISSLQLSRDLGITQKSAWFILHRIREMVREKAPQMLKNTVEADETFVGGKSKNWHAKKRREMFEKGTGYVHKTPVIGLLQRDGNVIAFKIEEAKGQVMKPIVRALVDKSAMLITDGFGGYKGLETEFYKHVVINHAEGIYGFEVFKEGKFVKFHTNSIEGFWSQFKRGIYGIYHNVSPKHLNRYCDEFAFRYNTRKQKDLNRFDWAIDRVTSGRLTYKDLIA